MRDYNDPYINFFRAGATPSHIFPTCTPALFRALRGARMATKRRVTPIQGKIAIAVTKEGDFYTVEQAAKILKLQRQLDEANRPWWRKMFGG